MTSRWRAVFRQVVWKVAALALALPAVTLLGCGAPQAKVSGKVTFEGKPVPGGTLTFAPIPSSDEDRTPGQPAKAEVQPDGSYVLGTKGAADGAQVGRHRVYYLAPPPTLPPGFVQQASVGPPPSPYQGLAPKTPEVEVKPGTNTIDLELVVPPPTPKR